MRALAAKRPVSAIVGHACQLGTLDIVLDWRGFALLPAHSVMIVADLHLEKAASFAARGQMLPPHETLDTLARLGEAVADHRPDRLVLLGDSFHSKIVSFDRDGEAARRLDALAKETHLLWIAGNHDPAPPVAVAGEVRAEVEIEGVILRHAPAADGRREIVGHLHPAARIATRAGRQRRKCFVHSPQRLLMPAFGALTGALDLRELAIAAWFADGIGHAHLLCRDRLEKVPLSALV